MIACYIVLYLGGQDKTNCSLMGNYLIIFDDLLRGSEMGTPGEIDEELPKMASDTSW